MSTVKARSRSGPLQADIERLREARVAELASSPVETARRLVAAEDALRRIETSAVVAIQDYGITQETPSKWVALGDLIRNLMAPIRDEARMGLRR